MEEWTVDLDGAQLVGESTGAGRAVVFLHAGVADRRMWSPQMAALDDAYYVLAYDRRGFGNSLANDVPYSDVADLAAVLDARNVEAAVLVGCSMGGLLAIDFALAFPQRVSGLVLIATAISGAPQLQEPYAPLIIEREQQLQEADEAGDMERVNELEAIIWLDGPASEAGRVSGPVRDLFLDMNGKALAHPPLTNRRKEIPAFERLPEINGPTLVLWGSLDYPDVITENSAVAQRIPHAQALEIPGVAHLVNLEEPALVSQLLLDFLGT